MGTALVLQVLLEGNRLEGQINWDVQGMNTNSLKQYNLWSFILKDLD